jgi:signal transduction histidine kinase
MSMTDQPDNGSTTPQEGALVKFPFEIKNGKVQGAIEDPNLIWTTLRNLPGVRSWRILSDSLFMLTSFPVGLAWFIIAVVGFAVGGALSFLGVGVLILAWTFALLLWGAQLERSRLRIFLNVNVGSPHHWSATRGNIVKRAWEYVRNPQVWRDIVYLLILFPIGILELALVFYPIEFLLTPFIWSAAGSYNPGFGWTVDHAPEAWLAFVVGLILVIPFSILINLGAVLHGQLGLLLLGTSNEEKLTERVEVLTESRSAVMRAMHMERRRIERDLHDGAQQRLVNLAMDLGRAREKLDSDPESARRIIDESHEQAKQVLTEMRDLVRGIHPAVLTDRGLDAAISAIAGRSPIPVEVDVNLRERLPEEVEGTAYFVVVESLTNVARHSGATTARVRIYREDNWLRIIIEDNGRGGADPDQGSGLRGLRDRIAALEGSFAYVSPEGRGTRISVEIPCG